MSPQPQDIVGRQTHNQIDRYRRFVLKAVGISALLPVGSDIARAAPKSDPEPEPVLSFNRDDNEFPENITVDKRGNTYLSMPPRGEIRKISPDTTQTTLTTLNVGDGGIGVLGLQADPQGHLYATLVSFNSANADTHGVWRISRNGTTDLFAALDPSTFPNDILLRKHSLLVTDSIGGAILRVTEDGPHEWLTDSLLAGDGSLEIGFPIGANGIAAAKDGTVYVANTERGRIVRIPVAPDGSAGSPTTFVEDPDLFGADGIAFDTRERLYVTVNATNTLVRITQEKAIETLADVGDGLDAPSDVAFGTGRGDRKTAFFTNFAFPAFSADPDPTLMKLDVGVPGLPIHR